MDGTLRIFGHAFILSELGFTRIKYKCDITRYCLISNNAT